MVSEVERERADDPGCEARRRRHGRAARLVVAVAAAAVVALGASPALAHIDPDPKEAPGGSVQSVGFTVEHGCAGSSTIQLDMRLPDGVVDATPEPPAGWTATVADDVVTFVGGPLPDDVEGTFRVRLTLPPIADTTIYFPFVQRCEQGEIRWIDIPSDGSGDELDEPAPAMVLTGPVVTTTTTTSPPTTTTTTTTAPTSTTGASTTTSTTPTTTTSTTPTTSTTTAATTAPPPATAVAAVAPDDGDDDDDGTSGPMLAGLAAGVAAVGAVVGLGLRRRHA